MAAILLTLLALVAPAPDERPYTIGFSDCTPRRESVDGAFGHTVAFQRSVVGINLSPVEQYCETHPRRRGER